MYHSDPLETSGEPLEDTDEYSELGDSDLEESEAWIDWFCGLKGNEYFVVVEEEYIRDDFNLTGLKEVIPYYYNALDIVLDHDDEDTVECDLAHQKILQRAAQVFYGLIHARFILTARGLNLMLEKYKTGVFGRCPNSYCSNQLLLPIGLSDFQNKHTVKVFCPRCNEIYHPRPARMGQIDGAFFGTTFPHMFCMVNESVLLEQVPAPVETLEMYIPRIYGFRVNKNVKDRLREAASALSQTDGEGGSRGRLLDVGRNRDNTNGTKNDKES